MLTLDLAGPKTAAKSVLARFDFRRFGATPGILAITAAITLGPDPVGSLRSNLKRQAARGIEDAGLDPATALILKRRARRWVEDADLAGLVG